MVGIHLAKHQLDFIKCVKSGIVCEDIEPTA